MCVYVCAPVGCSSALGNRVRGSQHVCSGVKDKLVKGGQERDAKKETENSTAHKKCSLADGSDTVHNKTSMDANLKAIVQSKVSFRIGIKKAPRLLIR